MSDNKSEFMEWNLGTGNNPFGKRDSSLTLNDKRVKDRLAAIRVSICTLKKDLKKQLDSFSFKSQKPPSDEGTEELDEILDMLQDLHRHVSSSKKRGGGGIFGPENNNEPIKFEFTAVHPRFHSDDMTKIPPTTISPHFAK